MDSVRVICDSCNWSSKSDSAIYNQVGYETTNHSAKYTILNRDNAGCIVREGYRDGGQYLYASDFPPCPKCKQLGTIRLEVYCKPCKSWTKHPQIMIDSKEKTVSHSFGCGDCERPILR